MNVNAPPPKAKKRQHHVARLYLRGWATDEKIFRIQAGKVWPAESIDNVAVQNKFYKLRALTEADEGFIRHWIAQTPEHYHASHLNTLRVLTLPFKFEEQFREAIQQHTELAEAHDVLVTNLQEDWHSGIEGDVGHLVEKMRSGDLSFLNNPDDCTLFYIFLPLQLFRTKGVRDKIFARFREGNVEAIYGVNIENCWIVLSEIMAHSVGGSLYFDRNERRPVLVENNTPQPFITCDHPMVNLLAESNNAAERLAFYYPI